MAYNVEMAYISAVAGPKGLRTVVNLALPMIEGMRSLTLNCSKLISDISRAGRLSFFLRSPQPQVINLKPVKFISVLVKTAKEYFRVAFNSC